MTQADSSLPQEPGKPRISRRILAVLMAVFLLIVGLIALAPTLLDQDKLRARFLSEISRWTGNELTSKGKFQLTLFPEFKATLNDVASTDTNAAIQLSAESIEIDLLPLPALIGRIESSAIKFNQADISVHAQADQTLADLWKRSPLGAKGSTAESQALSSIPNTKLATITLSQSALTAIALDGSKERVTNINGSLDWQRVRGSATLDASADWRGETLQVNTYIADPLAFAAGGNSDLNLKVASEPMTLSFEGTGNFVANFFAEGALSWKAPSMRRFLQWTQTSATAGESIGNIELNADLVTKNGKLFFSDVAMSVSGSVATGVLEIDPLTKPIKTSGTLAFKSVDLAELASSLPIGVGKDSVGELQLLSDLDLDLRLSAESAAIAGYSISNAAGAVRVAKGDASIDLGTGEIAGGTVMGRLELSGPTAIKSGKLALAFKGFQLDQIDGLPSGIPLLSGPLSGKFEMSGAYTSLNALFATGTGTLNLDLDGGLVRNFSLGTMQAAIEQQGSFELPSVYAGLSETKELSVSAQVKNGVIAIDMAKAIVDGRSVLMTGTVPLLSQGIALSGIITDVLPTETTKTLPFFVGGTWSKPLVTTRMAQ